MRILGIESSCDDTSTALLDCSEQGCFVLSEKTASQIEIHKKYGGVVPEIAGRMHAEKIVPLIEEVLKGQIRPDVIAVTAGPGLVTGLIVGAEAARALSYAWDIPVVAVNHLEGHLHSVEIKNQKLVPSGVEGSKIKIDESLRDNNNIQYPALALIVSGGHTELVYIKKQGKYEMVGKTVDDAAGECFDKVAKLLNLPYPGGPQISQLALTGNTDAIHFPRPMLKDDNYNFSFSGLKTSALYWLRDHEIVTNDFCASFEQAIIDVLVGKTIKAIKKYDPKTVILCGGVSANKKLRSTLEILIKNQYPIINFKFPTSNYCMDNAAMIAVAGYYQALQNNFTPWKNLIVDPNWEME